MAHLGKEDFVADTFNITDKSIRELEKTKVFTEQLTKTKFLRFDKIVQEMFLNENVYIGLTSMGESKYW